MLVLALRQLHGLAQTPAAERRLRELLELPVRRAFGGGARVRAEGPAGPVVSVEEAR